MRIYRDFKEAYSEAKRDVVEMGIRVTPRSMQDKIIEGNPEYETLEVQNYIYTVTEPRLGDLSPNQPWADHEFEERIADYRINPGFAWRDREEVWKEFLHEGKFAYTYNERLNAYGALTRIINRLKFDPDSRQCFLSIWDPQDIKSLGGANRVPCSLGYIFQVRQGTLNMTYLMRSCDVATHFHNDIYLAYKLQRYVAAESQHSVGFFTHYITSLHMYKKDAQGIF